MNPPPESDKPFSRAHTPDEMVEKLLKHMGHLVAYWCQTKMDKLEKEQCPIPYYLKSLLKDYGECIIFSILNLFDGSTLGIPCLNIHPVPHESDKAYAQDQRRNWWPYDNMPINDCSVLHEDWASKDWVNLSMHELGRILKRKDLSDQEKILKFTSYGKSTEGEPEPNPED